MKALHECRLYAFVDTAYLRGRDPLEVGRQLCEGGADILQLRAKGALPEEIRRLAENLLPITTAAGVPLVINDHPAIASAVGAPYCHLGQEDFFDGGYRHCSELQAAGFRCSIGLSTHAPEQARRALRAEPAYLAVGPVYPTPTKPGRPAVTLDYVRWAAAHIHLPWFAIGGITLETLDDVLAAGARRICVVSAILNRPDVAAACREFRRAMGI